MDTHGRMRALSHSNHRRKRAQQTHYTDCTNGTYLQTAHNITHSTYRRHNTAHTDVFREALLTYRLRFSRGRVVFLGPLPSAPQRICTSWDLPHSDFSYRLFSLINSFSLSLCLSLARSLARSRSLSLSLCMLLQETARWTGLCEGSVRGGRWEERER